MTKVEIIALAEKWEAVPQVPGQMQMDGGEQEPPKLLKLAGAVN